ncbi:molybdate transport system regulatory protein [Chitinivorax tropicus]|uniref:Molybdate transport system regulatory protein n=1 Tax=Chitinivorax tropicus TaxID=714531 RepID=A0A840MSM5_9PROT|nr:TOBE domain-containing protein [Chitinivorax tropicus]MBB5019406.1 molybdate transport system regulatory protein [Chitinivorax tropicus]
MNRLPATLTAIEREGAITLLEADALGHTVSLTLLVTSFESIWQVGQQVTLAFKDTEVSLAKSLSGRISLRNRFPVTVESIDHGKVLTRVKLHLAGHPLFAVITTRAAHHLDLQAGDRIEALIKANEMAILE